MFTAAAGMTTKDLLNRGVQDTYCFGPTLVENGEASEISGQFHQTSRYQRAAVGMVSPVTIIWWLWMVKAMVALRE